VARGIKGHSGFTKNAEVHLDRVLALLEQYKHLYALKSKFIEQETGLMGIEVRGVMWELARRGHAICSDKRGYHLGESAQDVDRAINNLSSRNYYVDLRIRALKKTRLRMVRAGCPPVEQMRLL
jgi:hypothetical protein